jgi:outer membrane protein assembly factor BamA
MNKYQLSKLIIFLLLLLTFSSQITVADENDIGKISQIVIMGNETTDDNVIFRELLVTQGDDVNDTLLIESKKRLQNLLLLTGSSLRFYPRKTIIFF